MGDFNTPFTLKDRSSRQKINKETQALNHTVDQTDLIDIYRTSYPKAEYTFFSSAHGMYSTLGHKSSLGKFKNTEIISAILSNQNAMKLEINYRKKNCKKHKHVEAKQCSAKYPRDHRITQRRNKNIPRNK